MKYWLCVGLAIVCVFLGLFSLLSIVAGTALFVVSLVNLLIDTGVDTLNPVNYIFSLAILVIVFAASTKLFIFFSKEKF